MNQRYTSAGMMDDGRWPSLLSQHEEMINNWCLIRLDLPFPVYMPILGVVFLCSCSSCDLFVSILLLCKLLSNM